MNRSGRAALNLPMAKAAFDAGDLDAAIEYTQQMVQAAPLNPAAYELLIIALVYRSYSDFDREPDRELALSISADGIEKLPRDVDMLAARAYALQASGAAGEAGRVALRVIERSPDHTLARIALSLAYGSQSLFEAALREAETAVRLADRNQHAQLESYRALGIAHGDLGHYRQALASIDRAISFNTRLIPPHFEAALFATQVGDIDRATVSYFRVVALDENNVKARARLCELSNRLKERQSALRYCQEATELAPQRADGWHKLGREYYLSGDFGAAQAAFSECARLQRDQNISPENLQLACWYLQGQAAEIRGDCPSLTRIYQEFLDLVEQGGLSQTWSYPPAGPPICASTSTSAPPIASAGSAEG